jgi:hypothetical protein
MLAKSQIGVGMTRATDTNVIALQNEALLKAFGNVGDLSQLELQVELGELRETWELLWQSILALMKPKLAWKHFKSHMKSEQGRQRLTLEGLAAMPNKYLEFRYGWMPLMRSIEGIYEVFIKGLRRLEKSQRIYTARGSLLRSFSTSHLLTSSTPMFLTTDFRINYNSRVRAKACVHYKIVNSPSLSDVLGLSPKFIPETAWELTTLSFVWDWFFTLGLWLKSVRTVLSGDFQILGNTCSVTINTEGDRTADIRPVYDRGTITSKSKITCKEYKRSINQPLPLPGVRYSVVLDYLKYLDLFTIGLGRMPKNVRADFKRAFLYLPKRP